ncbi:hypothetical protein FIA58_004320 [Flavobacterium jejuense]|uniref:Uncharacterized protein n=2 Tax=Flavobacterium jejuense TaxID=1544455 RepID=A0ABX0IP99_9FLAO|nr:hypothetical protein [Flavobacterium jejuense]
MTDIAVFYELKKSVLERYKKRYPYFDGNWKTFSAQDILNLIDDVQEETKNSVSEKWIYTHLKPETNEKLPRKDLLNIFSQYVGKSSWDEYKYEFGKQKPEFKKRVSKPKFKNNMYWFLGLLLVFILGFVFWKFVLQSVNTKTIQLKEQYTNEHVNEKTTKAFVIEDSLETEIPIENSKIKVKENSKIIVKNPLFKDKKVDLEKNPKTNTVLLEPNDYASILQGFIKSDIKDWQTRKIQLQKILHDNVEVIVMLKNNLGAEYFNKEEFSQKLIIPTASLKKMQIVEVKNDATNQITFIRLIQE